MINISFSRKGKALIKNRSLADYTVHKMANLTNEENERGKTEIPLSDGNKLVIRFGPVESSVKRSTPITILPNTVNQNNEFRNTASDTTGKPSTESASSYNKKLSL